MLMTTHGIFMTQVLLFTECTFGRAIAPILAAFRELTDTWWTWALDSGGLVLNPACGVSLVSQFVRALDGHQERLPLLYQEIANSVD
jgi:hypothetical protein